LVTCRCTVCSLITRLDGDLAVGKAAGEKAEHLELPPGEFGRPRGSSAVLRVILDLLEELHGQLEAVNGAESLEGLVRCLSLLPRGRAPPRVAQGPRQVEARPRGLERRAAAAEQVDGILEELARPVWRPRAAAILPAELLARAWSGSVRAAAAMISSSSSAPATASSSRSFTPAPTSNSSATARPARCEREL
jgi:hypothetical protein